MDKAETGEALTFPGLDRLWLQDQRGGPMHLTFYSTSGFLCFGHGRIQLASFTRPQKVRLRSRPGFNKQTATFLVVKPVGFMYKDWQ